MATAHWSSAQSVRARTRCWHASFTWWRGAAHARADPAARRYHRGVLRPDRSGHRHRHGARVVVPRSGAEIRVRVPERHCRVGSLPCPCAGSVSLTPISMTVAMGQERARASCSAMPRRIERMRRHRHGGGGQDGDTDTRASCADRILWWRALPGDEALASSREWNSFPSILIGLAIVEGAKARGLTPRSAGAFDAANGLGVQADIDGKRVLVGSRKFLRTARRRYAALGSARGKPWRAQAKTVVFFAVTVLSLKSPRWPIRSSEHRGAIAALKQSGVRVVMLTGDSHSTAEAVARQLGIDEAIAGSAAPGQGGSREALAG